MTWQRMRLIAIVMVVLLAISSVIISTGKQGRNTWPSVRSTRPSGTAALRELLEHQGWTVSQDRAPKPKGSEGELIVAFMLDEGPSIYATQQIEEAKPYLEHLREQARKGATVVFMPIAMNYDEASKQPQTDKVTASFNRRLTREVSVRPSRWPLSEAASKMLPLGRYTAYGTPVRPFIESAQIGEGSMWVVEDAMGATNRFLDDAQNAEFYVDFFTRLSRGKKEITFAEAGFGNSVQPTLTSLLGPWARTLQWQALLLLAVVIFTLGRRFGKPEIDPPVQRTTRDLLIAAGQAMKRGGHRDLALQVMYADAMDRLRNAVGALQTESEHDVLRRVPLEVADSVRRVHDLQGEKVKGHQIASALAEMESQVDAFCRRYRGGRTRP